MILSMFKFLGKDAFHQVGGNGPGGKSEGDKTPATEVDDLGAGAKRSVERRTEVECDGRCRI